MSRIDLRGRRRRERWAVAVGVVVLLTTMPGCSTTSTPDPVTGGPSATTGAAQVTSTLDGRSALPHRIHWEANPSGTTAVRRVDFLIDSRLAWTERNSPYFYGDDGNWLVTSFLDPGPHEFQTRLTTADGKTVSDTVTATVGAAQSPPLGLRARWTRVVSRADLTRESSEPASPVGRWFLTVDGVGWTLADPEGSGIRSDVAYRAPGRLLLRPTIETPPFPNDIGGGFCEEPDQEWTWAWTISHHGSRLTLRSVGRDPCWDRAAIYQGTWTRTAR